MAVTGAVLCAHHSPVSDGIAGLYVLPTIFTASFYSTRAFTIYLAAQAATSGAVLLTSGVIGASAGWAVLLGTTVTVGVAVHVLQQALQLAATTDPLTGLVNRRAFEPILARELHRCARLDHPLCLVVIDLDHFKEVNDAHGHQEGDRLLAEVSRRWTETLRSTDVLARAGGRRVRPSPALDQPVPDPRDARPPLDRHRPGLLLRAWPWPPGPPPSRTSSAQPTTPATRPSRTGRGRAGGGRHRPPYTAAAARPRRRLIRRRGPSGHRARTGNGVGEPPSRAGSRGLRRLTTRVAASRSRQRDHRRAGGEPGGRRHPGGRSPARRSRPGSPFCAGSDPTQAPAGDFTATACPTPSSGCTGSPTAATPCDAISSFALSYDGYAYWDDVTELATRAIRAWTRHRTLPTTVDEVRGCLFYEQRRWHHFGEEPTGRGAHYVWALLDSLRQLVAARTTDLSDRSPTGPSAGPPRRARRSAPRRLPRPSAARGRSARSWTTTPATWPGPPATPTASWSTPTGPSRPTPSILHRASCPCIGGLRRPGPDPDGQLPQGLRRRSRGPPRLVPHRHRHRPRPAAAAVSRCRNTRRPGRPPRRRRQAEPDAAPSLRFSRVTPERAPATRPRGDPRRGDRLRDQGRPRRVPLRHRRAGRSRPSSASTWPRDAGRATSWSPCARGVSHVAIDAPDAQTGGLPAARRAAGPVRRGGPGRHPPRARRTDRWADPVSHAHPVGRGSVPDPPASG